MSDKNQVRSGRKEAVEKVEGTSEGSLKVGG